MVMMMARWLMADGCMMAGWCAEYQQNWTWSPTRQVGRLGPHLGQARFVLTENRKKATLSIHTTLSWENGYACAAVMTEQEISDTRNRIRIKVARTTGFFTLGVCTGGSTPEPDYRGSFSAFVAWDNEMISYDVTGQLTNRYHRASTYAVAILCESARACVPHCLPSYLLPPC
jgi:hypothetical protein